MYSLGAILYELIADQLPFDEARLASASQTELEEILWEEDPPRPSKRATATVPSDLDWIVMKALDKDRNKRYESASAFADDVQRFLNEEPVLATPPSTTYHARKFVRRHRFGIAFAFSVAALLVAGTAVSLWQAIAARQAREVAQNEAATAKATVDFLTNDLLRMGDPDHEPDRDLKLSTALDRAAEGLSDRFQDQPAVKAELLSTLGKSSVGVGEFEKGIRLINEALALWKTLDLPLTGTQVGAQQTLAFAHFNLGQHDEALAILEPLFPRVEATFGTEGHETLSTMSSLARIYTVLRRYDESHALNSKAYAIYERQGKGRARAALGALAGLGSNYMNQGLPAEAEPIYRKYRSIVKDVYPVDSPWAFAAAHNVGAALMNQGKIKESIPILEEAHALSVRIRGANHPAILKNIHEMSGAYLKWVTMTKRSRPCGRLGRSGERALAKSM